MVRHPEKMEEERWQWKTRKVQVKGNRGRGRVIFISMDGGKNGALVERNVGMQCEW